MINRLLFITLLILPGSVFALQVIDVVDGQTVQLKVSQKELNRIAMADGARIDHIWSANDRIRIEPDQNAGQLFVRVTGNTPFSMFVRADNGETYTLLAAPADIPAQTIFLRPPYRNTGSSKSANQALPYMKRIEGLVKSLGRRALPEGYTPKSAPLIVPLWDEVQFKRNTIFTGNTLIGEVYTLTNLTSETLRLAERDFRILPGQPIVAIAIDKHELGAHESTDIFVIRDIKKVKS
ncbi:MAG: type-F conjugative transfer system secretin TraK [Gammaproteobacteria bacterium]|nr:type-F conjugative transfer system secretin TraK [Gammaproteobacteria bacterium]MDH5651251.1 type-F conjugative transfer system secretin TraK [Gammaproteobacteria bacterium]